MVKKNFQDVESLAEVLHARAKLHPDRQAFCFLEDGIEKRTLTYKELHEAALAVAAEIKKHSKKGDRAVLLYAPGLDYVITFFGCLYAGVIAVPCYPPDPSRLKRMMPRLIEILKDCAPRLILTTSELSKQMLPLRFWSKHLAFAKWISTDKHVETNISFESLELPRGNDISFLQYTSGSTGSPKGVIVPHSTLMHHVELIRTSASIKEDDRLLSWLPMYHDMGLIGQILHGVYSGLSIWVMSPFDFLKRPSNWLRIISEKKITLSGGPNFAFELCVNKISDEEMEGLDLSSWTYAFCGAEPIRPSTFKRFADKFSKFGFDEKYYYPCYGLAEATLIVSGARRGEGAFIGEYVSSGYPCEGLVLKIVNPQTLKECSPEETGEIWVQGGSNCAGYWGKPVETQKTFQAFIADTHEGPFLRTGDLGTLSNIGLTVTGRLKDLIIINGKNHYPSDIEDSISSAHPSIRPGCAASFSVSKENKDSLVVVFEIKKNNSANLEKVAQAVKNRIWQEREVSVDDIVIIEAGTIPKTTSGKIQRNQTKKDYLAGNLKILKYKEDTKPSLISWGKKSEKKNGSKDLEVFLTNILALELQIPSEKIGRQQNFNELGLTSIQAVAFAGKISDELKQNFSPALLWEHSTIEALSKYLQKNKISAPVEKTPVEKVSAYEPVAVIGIGLHLPGAKGPLEFWQNLIEGKDLVKPLGEKRWNWNVYPSDAKDDLLGANYLNAGYIEGVADFDPLFFGISPREAESMDPQQRIFLQSAWKALEDAGIRPSSLSGRSVGLFVGASSSDYAEKRTGLPEARGLHFATGNAHSVISNRLSYLLNFRGPSKTVDTACSSSLVAVHDAVRAIQLGECELALAGGVNAILSPSSTAVFAKAKMLSPQGKCFTFDSRSSGYVRGEGAGVVVLKKLSDAVRDGDPIYGIIKGSAVNHCGHTQSLTAPNPEAQGEVIAKAIQRAGIKPSDIGYIEAHGTATLLGDPIEINGIKKAFHSFGITKTDNTCYLGSVKTNIGHLEAAAGIAGLIKILLSVKLKSIPRHLNFEKLNPHIDFENLAFKIPSETVNWTPVSGKKRVAGVSSFGFGGANCHIIVEEFATSASKPNVRGPLVISAKTPERLRVYAETVISFLATDFGKSVTFAELHVSLTEGREIFEHRLNIECDSLQELNDLLRKFVNGEASPKILVVKEKSSSKTSGVVKGKISLLPTYPFAQERFWLEDGGSIVEDKNTTLTVKDFYLKDHIVNGKHILPGVFYLELLTRELKSKGLPLSISNFFWRSPIIVSDSYKISITNGEDFWTINDERGRTHGQGQLTKTEQARKNVSKDIVTQYKQKRTSSPSEIYERFKTVGLFYGPSFRCINELYEDETSALGRIDFSSRDIDTESFFLHPSLLDAALGVCVGIDEFKSALSERKTFIPFSMGEMIVHGPIKGAVWSLATLDGEKQSDNEKKYNVVIFNDAGEVLIEVKGFVVRSQTFMQAESDLFVLKPSMKEVKLEAIDLSSSSAIVLSDKELKLPLFKDILVLSNVDSIKVSQFLNSHERIIIIDALELETTEHLLLIQDLCKLVHKSAHNKDVHWMKVGNLPSTSAFAAFSKSVQSDLPRVKFRSVHGSADIASLLATFSYPVQTGEFIFQGTVVSLKETSVSPYAPSVKDVPAGTYVITGGSGGIAREITKNLSERKDISLILLGRSPEAKWKLPSNARYMSVDINDKAALIKTFQNIGNVTAVFHAAGVASHSKAIDCSKEDFQKVLDPKIKGANNLVEVIDKLKITKLVLFSSTSSVLGDFSGGHYSSANRYLDTLSEKDPRCISINWPLWKEGGMDLPAKEKELYVSSLGLRPIESSEAMSFLAQVLSGSDRNIGMIAGQRKKVEALFSAAGAPKTGVVSAEKTAEVLAYLKGAVSSVFKIKVEQLSDDGDLIEFGLDSMTVTEFYKKIQDKYGEVLTLADLSKNTRIDAIAALISSQLQDENTETVSETKVFVPQVVRENSLYPLSVSQEAMYFLHHMNPESVAYNVVAALKVRGDQKLSLMKHALTEVIARQSILRVSFVDQAGSPSQWLHGNPGVDISIVDKSGLGDQEFDEWLYQETKRPFELSEPPLRALICQRGPNYSVLSLTVHHIVFDGLSLLLILKQWMETYEKFKLGEFKSLPPLKNSYFDFIEEQKSYLASSASESNLKFWKNKLKGDLVPVTLPADFNRPAVKSENGKTFSYRLGKDQLDSIKSLARKNKATPYAVVLSSFLVFLKKLTSQQDLIIGTPVLGRTIGKYDDVIGYFVNMMVVRENVGDDTRFEDLLQQVDRNVKESIQESSYPFPLLVQKLDIKRDPSRSPIFEVCLVYQNMLNDAIFEDGNDDRAYAYHHINQQEGQFDLELELIEKPNGIVCNFKYCTDLFKEKTIQEWARAFEWILKVTCSRPELEVKNVDGLSIEQEVMVVKQFNDTKKDYDLSRPLQSLFEDLALSNPNALALWYEDESLSYKELNEKANQLAHHLRHRGVVTGDSVVVLMERSLEMVISLYGILKAGAAYVPVDPTYPEGRIDDIVEQTKTKLILTQERFADKAKEKALIINDKSLSNFPKTAPDLSDLTPEHIAYVIFTSGSTGKPKGVMVPHKGIVNRLIWMQEEYRLTPKDRILQKTPYGFDVSVWEFFWPLMYGASLYILPAEMHKDSTALASYIRTRAISVLHFVPSMLAIFLEEQMARFCISLRLVFCSGEALQLDHQKKTFEVLPNTELHNLYGPTEASVDVTYWPCSPQSEIGFVPIGKPIANMQTYILDANMKPVLPGVAGELCLGGVGLAKGYLGRDDLTKEKFVQHPFSKNPEDKIYLTGDLARYHHDGKIEYLGRKDFQVKIRGLRIELGEIETQILNSGSISNCVVVAPLSTLVAYVVMKPGASFEQQVLKEFLAKSLPDYMVPQFIVRLPELPLSDNGKVNRKALPEFKIQPAAGSRESLRGSVEEEIGRIWKEVLRLDEVYADQEFFTLGGNSLTSIKVVHEILKKWPDCGMTVREFYNDPTVRGIAKAVQSPRKTAAAEVINDWETEVVLPEMIQFKTTPRTVNGKKTLLLTGATGFLGAYLLKELIEKDEYRIITIVRGKDDFDGFKRLKKNMKQYGLWKAHYWSKVIVYIGDIGKSKLGLADDIYDKLSKSVDLVLHNAARVNFLDTYQQLKKENVGGTTEILRFCGERNLKELHYVSTISVFASLTYGPEDKLGETIEPSSKKLYGGYAQSKWVAERLVRIACDRGLPVSIYRPGTLTGDERGIGNKDDLFNRLLLGITEMNSMPDIKRKFDVTPVDFAARALVALMKAPMGKKENIFHISNPKSLKHSDFFAILTDLGHAMKLEKFSEWKDRLMLHASNPLYPLLPIFSETYEETGRSQAELTEQQPQIICPKTTEMLNKWKISCPEIGAHVIELYLKYLQGKINVHSDEEEDIESVS